jgi:hypothetical protein
MFFLSKEPKSAPALSPRLCCAYYGAVTPYPTLMSFLLRRKKNQKSAKLRLSSMIELGIRASCTSPAIQVTWRLGVDPQNLFRRILQASLVRSCFRAFLFQIPSLMPVCHSIVLQALTPVNTINWLFGIVVIQKHNKIDVLIHILDLSNIFAYCQKIFH